MGKQAGATHQVGGSEGVGTGVRSESVSGEEIAKLQAEAQAVQSELVGRPASRGVVPAQSPQTAAQFTAWDYDWIANGDVERRYKLLRLLQDYQRDYDALATEALRHGAPQAISRQIKELSNGLMPLLKGWMKPVMELASLEQADFGTVTIGGPMWAYKFRKKNPTGSVPMPGFEAPVALVCGEDAWEKIEAEKKAASGK